MKERQMQKNAIEKISTLKKALLIRFPSLDVQKLIKTMGELAHYHYNKKNNIILGEQKEIYNFLITDGYNPFTVYRWLLIERIPEDIRFQLRERKISQKKAVHEAFKRRHETETVLTVSIKELGLELIKKM